MRIEGHKEAERGRQNQLNLNVNKAAHLSLLRKSEVRLYRTNIGPGSRGRTRGL